jgi:hypothetical protein
MLYLLQQYAHLRSLGLSPANGPGRVRSALARHDPAMYQIRLSAMLRISY